MEIDFVDAFVRAILIGIVALLAYWFQKDIERRTEKRDLARIMRNEINNLIQVNHHIARNLMPPSEKAYDGLLHTGNIRYFSESMRITLGRIYENFDRSNIPRPNKAHEVLLKELEDMARNNMEIKHLVRQFCLQEVILEAQTVRRYINPQ